MSSSPARLLRTIVLAGVTVGVLDMLFATVTYVTVMGATTFEKLWQGVGAALIGREAALAGGAATMAFGLCVHFGVAHLWSTVFAVAYDRIAALRRSVHVIGTVLTSVWYGPFIWAMMQLVLVPMTRNTVRAFITPISGVMALGHIVFIALPIVAITRRGLDSPA